MSLPLWLGILVWTVSLAGWPVAWLVRRSARRAIEAAQDSQRSVLVDHEPLVGSLRNEVEIARRRADEYFEKIADIEAERNGWRARYFQNALEHGNAQGLLTRQIDVCIQQFHRLREAVLKATTLDEAKAAGRLKLSVNPVVARVVAEFSEHHVEPVKQMQSSGQSGPGPA